MSDLLEIREEQPDDSDAINSLTIAAFSHSAFGHNGEAQLVEALRAGQPKSLSLVACLDGVVVGHILFTPAFIKAGQETTVGMGLGPMSVLPNHQRNGIGSNLIQEGLRRLWANECPFVFVLGHPDYYPKFDFRPAADWSIAHGFEGIPQNVFFVRARDQVLLEALRGGEAHYAIEFGPQHGNR